MRRPGFFAFWAEWTFFGIVIFQKYNQNFIKFFKLGNKPFKRNFCINISPQISVKDAFGHLSSSLFSGFPMKLHFRPSKESFFYKKKLLPSKFGLWRIMIWWITMNYELWIVISKGGNISNFQFSCFQGFCHFNLFFHWYITQYLKKWDGTPYIEVGPTVWFRFANSDKYSSRYHFSVGSKMDFD